MAKEKIDRLRLLRGGSLFDLPGVCRSANRNWNDPGFRSNLNGFRVVQVPKPFKKEQENTDGRRKGRRKD